MKMMMMMMVRRRVRKRCMRARSEAMPEDAFRSEALTPLDAKHQGADINFLGIWLKR
jgi:hypothetical protein